MTLRIGLDIGSTTVKAVVLNVQMDSVLSVLYRRHHARQKETAVSLLRELQEQFGDTKFSFAVCGSGGKPAAEALQCPYIQEVVANAAAVQRRYPQVRCAIELGGQDAKVIFFTGENGRTEADDMRMNGSCAGGTGAFIDEIASLLGVETADFEGLASAGTKIYDISGRCGVFAKTDIQPLLLSGAKREDIALSAFHAIAKQTIGGLSQGLTLKPPILFAGGPMTFNPTLIRVFSQHLHLKKEDIVLPEYPETVAAYGAAVAASSFADSTMALSTAILRLSETSAAEEEDTALPFFADDGERQDFFRRHRLAETEPVSVAGGELFVHLGIDAGSTTVKIAVLDEEERLIDRFYTNNRGAPLDVIREGLLSLYETYAKRGITLRVLSLGTTGYGEMTAAEAFGADYHTVETVAHVCGCRKYVPDASFILDIGGQDMKAIWLSDGIITNIMLNEACSSGCGSFLETFAASLCVPAAEIAERAFSAKHPASLGSRCTVFMNSTIITEQRRGKTAEEILAGLCRSIVENVFTKVVRITNARDLGEKIVVQGGTFRNFAVLRALEEYLERPVILAPYPGEMGAIGAALLAKGRMCGESQFIGFEAVRTFSCRTETGLVCKGCANRCSRTMLVFSTGKRWISGNRCEKGGMKEDAGKSAPNLFELREKLLFKEYAAVPAEKQNITVGIPRVLEFWDSMPFWTTFFRSLGFLVKISPQSSEKQYGRGISYVASDTVCFPAKLVHGHICDLIDEGVDRIFFPYIMHMPPEGQDKLSPYVCSIVQGYPLVVRHSQTPDTAGCVYDTPVFHWFTEKNREEQIIHYAVSVLGVKRKDAEAAFYQAEQALKLFRKELRKAGHTVITETRTSTNFAVVLAGRPYHTDTFVNHHLPQMFARHGIPVLPVDALPDLHEVDLKNTRVEITNNYHTRMLAGARLAAETLGLEYVQLVSFGCGHDAVLSDEVVRILDEVGKKPALILKVDESAAEGALSIRVRSFIESIQIRHAAYGRQRCVRELQSAYPAKFTPEEKKRRTLLVPNISEHFSVLLNGLLEKEGFTVQRVPVGGIRQIKLGKKYSHNDICFPCQMVIGELIDALQSGNHVPENTAVGMVKFQCDCRMSHYAALLRKALDAAGYQDVPVVTTDFNDSKKTQPGVQLLGIRTVREAVWLFIMLDMVTDLARKTRPYELRKGETNETLDAGVEALAEAVKRGGIKAARQCFEELIDALSAVPFDRTERKPRVLVTGELLVTYHPGSNFHIEEYLEANGMETLFPRITDQLRKDILASLWEIQDYKANIFPYPYAVDALFDFVQKRLEKSARRHPLYEESPRPRDMYEEAADVIPKTLSCGEGWLMAAEIAHYAKDGVKLFVILQPFGCLPNHICGRGVVKRLKEDHPGISILPLDLDPDTSYANVENRLQMLIMNRREQV